MITFACPGCGKNFQVKAELAGRKTKCPKCGQALLVPTPSVPVPVSTRSVEPPPRTPASSPAEVSKRPPPVSSLAPSNPTPKVESESSRIPEQFKAPIAENLGGAFAGPYFESSRPSGNATCSDDSCPCPGAIIAPGTGYLYISKEVIEFRKDAIAESEAAAKIQDVQRKLGAIVANPNLLASPILMCRMGAEKRGIDLAWASRDAQHWWKTGQVPLRPTPMAGQAASAHAAVESSPKGTGTHGNTAAQAAIKEELAIEVGARCGAQHMENTGQLVSLETTKKWFMAIYTLDQQQLERLLADNDALQRFLKALLIDPQQAARAVRFGQLAAKTPPARQAEGCAKQSAVIVVAIASGMVFTVYAILCSLN